jgi:predicted nucleic acid-binding protein
MALLLDAGVWIAAANSTEQFYEEAGTLLRAGGQLAALDLTLFEIANTVGVKWKRQKRAAALLDAVLVRCQKRLVRVEVETLRGAIDVAAEHGLTAYDAAYVAVARRNGWTLVSTDFRDLVSQGLAVAPDAAV